MRKQAKERSSRCKLRRKTHPDGKLHPSLIEVEPLFKVGCLEREVVVAEV